MRASPRCSKHRLTSSLVVRSGVPEDLERLDKAELARCAGKQAVGRSLDLAAAALHCTHGFCDCAPFCRSSCGLIQEMHGEGGGVLNGKLSDMTKTLSNTPTSSRWTIAHDSCATPKLRIDGGSASLAWSVARRLAFSLTRR